MSYGGWRPYVPVAKRRADAVRKMKQLRSKGEEIEGIEIQGRNIAHSFWGKAWCKHLEQFSDFDNRLPRGRTYVRNGSVCHLAIRKGKIEALVSGSELYHVNIQITALASARWKNIRKQCAGQIGSMLELLQGRLSSQVMSIVTDPAKGLFPQPREIKFQCDCPDWADMCKHIAAVLYGVGARLDEKPEHLFTLRKVDHLELISADLDMQTATTKQGKRRRLANQDLSNMFGIDIEETTPPLKKRKPPKKKTARRVNPAKQSQKTTTTARSKPKARKTKPVVKKKTFTQTGAAVARLRKQLKLSRSEFADLIGVSPQSVTNWEAKRGKLKLQTRTLEALSQAWLQQ